MPKLDGPKVSTASLDTTIVWSAGLAWALAGILGDESAEWFDSRLRDAEDSSDSFSRIRAMSAYAAGLVTRSGIEAAIDLARDGDRELLEDLAKLAERPEVIRKIRDCAAEVGKGLRAEGASFDDFVAGAKRGVERISARKGGGGA